jgi:predicted RNA-binding protein with TRAM domain
MGRCYNTVQQQHSWDIAVVFSDKPTPPQHVTVNDVCAESCLLSWDAPEDDGGTALTQYVVEMMDLENRGKWSEAGTVEATSDKRSLKCNKLKEGHKYKFRIRAVNKVGASNPAEIKDTMLAKNLWDPPGPPRNLEATDWDKNRVDLEWEIPLMDGGAPITGYVIECKERFSADWIKCLSTETADTKATVKEGLIEGKTYEFRLQAVTKAGPGAPSEPTKQITCKSRFVKPFIRGDGMRDIVIKCGQTLTWEVQYGGEPTPDVAWFSGDKVVESDGERITINRYEQNTVITVRRCTRADSTKYKLVLTNSSGSAETKADGVVLGKPSRPMGPLEITDVRANKATVKWKKPEDDGGSPITGYVLEKRDLDSGLWVPCGEAKPDDDQMVVEGLQKGKKYKFRVKAVNKEGQSEPLESDNSVEAKNPYREPDPPRDLTIFDWDNETVTLRWDVPEFDGGRPITHFIIEQKGKFDSDFIEVLETKDNGLEVVVGELREKQDYEWRARAVNKAGKSKPCAPTPKHTCWYRNSKSLTGTQPAAHAVSLSSAFLSGKLKHMVHKHDFEYTHFVCYIYCV